MPQNHCTLTKFVIIVSRRLQIPIPNLPSSSSWYLSSVIDKATWYLNSDKKVQWAKEWCHCWVFKDTFGWNTTSSARTKVEIESAFWCEYVVTSDWADTHDTLAVLWMLVCSMCAVLESEYTMNEKKSTRAYEEEKNLFLLSCVHLVAYNWYWGVIDNML